MNNKAGMPRGTSFRNVVVGSCTADYSPFNVEVLIIVTQFPDVFGEFRAVRVFPVFKCRFVL